MIEHGGLLRSRTIAKIGAVVVWLWSACAALAQATFEERSRLSDDQTKLEAFTGTIGQVTVKEFTDTGRIEARGTVTVSATTIRDAGSGAETKGIAFTIRGAALPRDLTGFVDYDEIESLLKAIDYLAKIEPGRIKLANFEAMYQSRGDVRIVVLNSDVTGGRNLVSLEFGRVPGAKADFRMEELGRLRDYISAAKNILDNPDAPAAKGARARVPPVANPETGAAPAAVPVPTPAPKAKAKAKPKPADPEPPAAPFPKPAESKPAE